ncbi:HAD-IIA family hydrolase [Allosediminivita pacifica]|uniref:HAD superfamily hydrolase (TIGR01450 family) n=1 Tax=Allosediminivita pacifica TaxID=1267769 RepID=A0A2T6AJH0_9RHOB|nr:HAD hydrolase-like protein [Allosediminivita pacifica]PTX43934.1 HAD superfamily hydrolase (TIGR01450 family) [Allosediminivita pacifica]
MDPVRAFEAYLEVRPRLPDAVFPAGWQAARNLGDVADGFDLILLDAYGVLNVGESPIQGAAGRISALRALGKAVMVVSNSAGYPKRRMMQRYARLGFDFTPEEVVTSREALLEQLAYQPWRSWGVMLTPDPYDEELNSFDFTWLGDAREAYDRAEGFLLIGSDGWTETRQVLLEASLRDRPRPVLVGNPDLVAPREDGLSQEPGHFAHRLFDKADVRPRFFGKPFRGIYELALGRHQVDPARVLMVGDTLHTDILGGRHMGFATALVTGHGALAGLNVEEAITRSGIVPDYVVPHI